MRFPGLSIAIEAARSIGAFDSAYQAAEDFEWVCRGLRLGLRFGNLDQPLHRGIEPQWLIDSGTALVDDGK